MFLIGESIVFPGQRNVIFITFDGVGCFLDID